jgi:hypothetical protein
LTFGAYAANGTFETFIDTLKLFQENRFRVVVYRETLFDAVELFEDRVNADGGTLESKSCVYSAISSLGGQTGTSKLVDDFETRVLADGGTIQSTTCVASAIDELGGQSPYELHWVGWVTQDLVSVEDASAPYIYEITATDGIGRLANVEYDEANGVIETNGLQVTRVTEVLKNALTNIGTADLWGSSDVFFETAVDWWETNAQTYSTSVDPAFNQGFDVRYFNERDDNGDVVYPPTLEILRQMATLYNARIFMQRGRFVFEQYGNRDAVSRYVSRYTKTGTAISRTAINDDVAVDQTTFAARRSGNNYNFLPAAQSAKIHYVQRFLNPFNAFSQYRFRTTTNAFTAGFIAGGVGVQLAFGSTPFNFRVVGPSLPTSPVFPVFKMRIRIKDSSTGTFYYCNRAYLGVSTGGAMFGIPAWSTTAGEYFFDMPAFFTSGIAVVASNIQIITPDIPVNGEIDFQLQHHGVFRSSNGSTYTPTQTPVFDGTFIFGINTDGATNSPGATFSSTNAEVGIDSKLTIDLGDVLIADGPFQSGHLAAYNGSSWVGTQDWRKGASGTALPVLKLLSNETLALHVRPIEQYNGNVISSSLFGQRLTFDSTAYIMTSGTYTANADEWSGTWYKIQTIRTAVTALDELPDLLDRLPLTSATTYGVSPNDIIGGRIAGMVVDIENEKVGPFEQTTTGGKIGGTLDVVGNAVFDSNVQVDGDTTIVGTIDVTDLEVSNDLDVSGSTTLGGLSAGTTTLGASTISSASVTGNTSVGGTLGVTGTSTLGTLNAGTSTLGAATLSSASVTGNTSVGGTLGVTGASTLGTLNAAATAVTTLAASSNTTIGGTLGVTGTSTLGTLNAAATAVTTLAASSNTTIGGTLGVTGASTLGTLNAGTSTLGSASVTGNTSVGGTLGVTGASTLGTLNAGTTTLGAATLASSSVTGNQTIGGTLGVTGTATLGTLNAAATSVTTLAASSNTTIGGTLGVTGTSTLDTLNAGASTLSSSNVTGNASVGGTLGVTGASTLTTLNAAATSVTTLAASSNTTIGGTLGVTGTSTLGTLNAGTSTLGASTLSSANVTGNQTIGGTLGVTGTSTLGTLNAGTSTLGASTIGSATITGDASVGGSTTLANVTANDVTAADVVLDNVVSKTAVIGTTGLVDAFRARVLADGGTFEAFDEVVTAVTELLAGGSNKSAVIYGETNVQTLAAEATSVTTLAASGASTLATLSATATSVTTLAASSNASVGGTLGVTGTATMNSATINGAATLNSKTFVNGSWNSNIVDVTAEPSSVYKVGDNDYILFVTWSGGNGTFDIELPAVDASAGRMIRVKTDDTISNSKSLSIIPADGDTGVLIDGEASSSMRRSYDGATYLCHKGDWWVIQKKDKG